MNRNKQEEWQAIADGLLEQIATLKQQLEQLEKSNISLQALANEAIHKKNEIRQQNAELLKWQRLAFEAHPNIDIDISAAIASAEVEKCE